jgi:nitrate reductase NapE
MTLIGSVLCPAGAELVWELSYVLPFRRSGAHVNKLCPGATPGDGRRKQELAVFLVLTLLLAPVLAITTVGGYGLAVSVYQMIAGPPGPPAKAPRPPGIVPKAKAE